MTDLRINANTVLISTKIGIVFEKHKQFSKYCVSETEIILVITRILGLQDATKVIIAIRFVFCT